MSLGEMQACLARLYVDEAFRKLFFLDTATLADYQLSPEEAAAITGIDRRTLDFFARSLKNKRRGRFDRAYPGLQKVSQTEFDRYYSRYYQLYMARPSQSLHDDVLAFGLFYEESAAGADHLPRYVGDLARYERLYYRIRFAPRLTRPEPRVDSPPAPHRITSDAAVPYLRDGVEFGEFGYDVYEVEERLVADGAPPAADTLAGGPTWMAFRPSTATSAAKILRLNGATRAVLTSCDGHRTVDAIVADLEAGIGASGLHDGILQALNQLLAYEVLTLDPLRAAAATSDQRCYGTAQSEGM